MTKRLVCWLLLGSMLCMGLAAGAKNILVMDHIQVFGTIDPARGTDYTETYAMLNVYDPLLFPNAKGELQPHLATAWTVTADGLSYTFTIREGVRFHDGSLLTAEDVKFSFDRIMALQDGFSWLWSGLIEQVTVDDTYVVSFHLTEPFAPFTATLPWLFIVNKDLLMENAVPGDYGEFMDYGSEWLNAATSEDAGSGPYSLKSWDRGREIVFERVEDYWAGWPKGDASVDEVHSMMITESATVLTMMRKGELTLTDYYRGYTEYEEMAKADNVVLVESPSTEVISFKLNTKVAPTDDIHIRKMLAYAFDYATMTDQLEPGSTLALGPVAPNVPGHNPNLFQYAFDLDKAREELEQSSYYPDVPTIQLVTPQFGESRRNASLRLKELVETLGVNVEIRLEPWGRMTELASTVESTPNIMLISVLANYPDADSYLYGMYHSDAAGTWMSTEWLLDPEVDRLITESRKVVDPVERTALLYEVQELITGQVPDVYMNVMPIRVAMQDFLKGFTPRPIGTYFYYFRDWWYEN